MDFRIDPLQLLVDEALRAQVSDHGKQLVAECARQLANERAALTKLRQARQGGDRGTE